MKNKIVCILLMMVLVVGGCKERDKEVVRIGVALPLTGDIASYGINSKNGLELALETINADSSMNIKFEFIVEDTKGDTKTAVNIMQKFCITNDIQVVIGAAASSVSAAMIPIADKNKVLQISPVSSSPDLTAEDYFFRVCPSDAYQAVISANWIKEDGYTKVGVLYVNNSWGSSLMKEFKKNFINIDGNIVVVEATDEGDRDFKTPIAKLLSSDIEAIYCPTYGKEGGLILKQLKELGNKLPVYGADVWSSPELISTAGETSNGVKIVKPSELASIEYTNFEQRFSNKYGQSPDVYAAYSYDIIMILAEAIRDGNVTGEELKKYLLSMSEYSGVTGPTKFDSNGDCNSKPFIKQVINHGKYQNL